MLHGIKTFFTTRDRRVCWYTDVFVTSLVYILLTSILHAAATLMGIGTVSGDQPLTSTVIHLLSTDVLALLATVVVYAYYRKRTLAKLNIAVVTSLDVAEAINNNSLEIVLQPISRLSNNTIVGFESLVRLNHPKYGLIPPCDLMPILNAADPSLSRRLTSYVIHKTAMYYHEFLDDGYDFQMSVNLHPDDLTDNAIISTINNIMLVSGMPTNRLTVEMSESMIDDDTSTSIKVLAGLDTLDVKIALDEYGTRVTSYLHFRDFLVDEVKIDDILTTQLDHNQQSAEIVQSVIYTAHSVGAYVTAKRVETRAAHNKVRDLGCDFVQGYIIAPPMSFEQARVWIRTQRVSGRVA